MSINKRPYHRKYLNNNKIILKFIQRVILNKTLKHFTKNSDLHNTIRTKKNIICTSIKTVKKQSHDKTDHRYIRSKREAFSKRCNSKVYDKLHHILIYITFNVSISYFCK